MYLGVKAVIAKSIERIHLANLINFAIVPLIFANPEDYDNIDRDDQLRAELLKAIENADETIEIENITKNSTFVCKIILSQRQRKILFAGGLLPMVKNG